MNIDGDYAVVNSTLAWSCPLCQKPFSQESSYSRHVAYCRRTQNRPRVRSKACRACNASKVKCTFQRPCRRCSTKGLECSYESFHRPDQLAVPAETSRTREPGALKAVPASTSAMSPNAPAEVDIQLFLDTLQMGHAFESPDMGLPMDDDLARLVAVNDDFTSLTPDSQKELASSFEPLSSSSLQLFDQRSSSSFSGLLEKTDSTDSDSWMMSRSWNDLPALLKRQKNLPIPFNALSGCIFALDRLEVPGPVAQNCARLIWQAMRAYPVMMLRRETFPPFIHPHWHRQTTPSLPWPLANCMSIAHLFASRTAETKSYLWEAVKTESQRFHQQLKHMSNDECMAAIQAHLIYIIMRLVDGATTPPDFNHQLLTSYALICYDFHGKIFQALENNHLNISASWASWIFMESFIRTNIVFFLISRLVRTYIPSMCRKIDQYHALLLCSAKGPWEARTPSAFESEHAATYTSAQSASLSTVGELIEAQGMAGNRVKAQALDNWNAGVDSLGTLLNIATMGLI